MQPSTPSVAAPTEPVTVFLAFLEDEGGIYLGGSVTFDGAKEIAEQSEYANPFLYSTMSWNDEPREWNDGKGTREWQGTLLTNEFGGHDYYTVRETVLS